MSARDVIADNAHWLGAFDDAGRSRDATMILAALRAAGYAVVPKKITDATCALALGNKPHSILLARAIWDALILAAEEECK